MGKDVNWCPRPRPLAFLQMASGKWQTSLMMTNVGFAKLRLKVLATSFLAVKERIWSSKKPAWIHCIDAKVLGLWTHQKAKPYTGMIAIHHRQ